jgi:hypothetical protein
MKADEFIEAMPDATRLIYKLGCLRLANVKERRNEKTAVFKFRYWHPLVMLIMPIIVVETVLHGIFSLFVEIKEDMSDMSDEGITININKYE